MQWILAALLVGSVWIFTGCSKVKFSTTKPSESITDPTQQSTRDVTYSGTIQSANNKLDITLIVDDSNSMLADNQKLAARMADFVTNLQNSSIDWQMCATVTRALSVNGNPAWGASVVWSNYTPASGVNNWVLKPTANLSTIFANTINNIGAGWANTDDERGIKSAWWHLYNGDINYPSNSKCYRADAALAMILISDEDERSVGGDASQQYYANEYKALESDDLPENLMKQVRDIFGTSKRFTFNSIIVKPGDSACMATQDSGGAKSHYGVKYNEMSTLSGGGVGSICEANYSTNLNLFKDSIQGSIGSHPLECAPVGGTVEATVTPAVAGLTTTVNGSSLVFSPSVPVGRTLTLKYKCYN